MYCLNLSPRMTVIRYRVECFFFVIRSFLPRASQICVFHCLFSVNLSTERKDSVILGRHVETPSSIQQACSRLFARRDKHHCVGIPNGSTAGGLGGGSRYAVTSAIGRTKVQVEGALRADKPRTAQQHRNNIAIRSAIRLWRALRRDSFFSIDCQDQDVQRWSKTLGG